MNHFDDRYTDKYNDNLGIILDLKKIRDIDYRHNEKDFI